MKAIKAHITKYYGDIAIVLHEKVSVDIHVDIAVIKPTEERNYYTLVTMGMGAYRMKVPQKLADIEIERAELMICLPPDWELPGNCSACDDSLESSLGSFHDEKVYWPIRWLNFLAHFPIGNNTWIGYGHTVPNGENAEPFAENTKLGCVLFIPPIQFDEEADRCEMPDGGSVVFYQILPIYADEMNYKLENGVIALMEKFDKYPTREDILTLDINRPSVLSEC